jgi:exonuclease SbcD
MRFIHSSDWHLGRQLHGVSLLEDQRHVLAQINSLCAEHAVDALIIAGDVYDRSVPPADAVTLLSDFLQSILQQGIQVLIIAGNHDGPERLGFASDALAQQGLHIAGPVQSEIPAITLNGQDGSSVDFFLLPYADPQSVRHVFDRECKTHDDAIAMLTETALAQRSERPCVAISHCFIDGGEESDSERPLSIGGADRVSPKHFMPFDYTALGHLHGHQFKGKETIRYSGSLLKYSFSEVKQKKAVTLVDINADGIAHEQLLLQPLRDLRVLEGSLADILSHGENDPDNEDYVLARLSDTHAILDVMGKLRDVYPNALHVERPALQIQQAAPVDRQLLQQSEEDIVRRFYEQVQGEEVNAGQEALLQKLLGELHKEVD